MIMLTVEEHWKYESQARKENSRGFDEGQQNENEHMGKLALLVNFSDAQGKGVWPGGKKIWKISNQS